MAGRRNIFETFDPDTIDSDFDLDLSEDSSESDGAGDSDSDSNSSFDPNQPSTSTGRARNRSRASPTPNESHHSQSGPNLPDHVEPWVYIEPPEVDRQIPFEFRVRNVGVANIRDDITEPIDFFSLLFPDWLIEEIVQETNRYAFAFLNKEETVQWLLDHPKSRYHAWPEDGISVEELKKYLGLLVAMGVVKKKLLADYWSTHSVLETPFFGRVMSRKKFELIKRMLHINDISREIPRGHEGFDPWVKIRIVLDTLNLLFKDYLVPPASVSIDESIVGMKNKTVYLQYLKNKRHNRFGIKKFELCTETGYVIHIALYAGKDFDLRCREGQGHAVVLELMQAANLLNKGYRLFTDRFYTKPQLAADLLQRGTLLTGTTLSNAKGLPRELSQKLDVGGTRYMRSGNILGVAFREKKTQTKPVVLISTQCPAVNETRLVRGKEKTKPLMIYEYNAYMGGVDMSDKKLYHYASERSTHRYWVKVFQNLLDIAILNSHELFRLKTGTNMDRKSYILNVVMSLCGQERPATPRSRNATPLSTPPLPLAPAPIPAPIPKEHRLVMLEGKQELNCAVCSTPQKRKRSRAWCPDCNVGVHLKCEPQHVHTDEPQKGPGRRHKRPNTA